MKTIEEAFAVVEVFQNVKSTTLKNLSTCGVLTKVKKGEHLFKDKQEVSSIYIVIEGMAALYKINSEGDKKVIFVLGKGKMLNEVILQELPASVNCEIIQDALILSFSKDKLLYLMEQDFKLTKAIIDSMSLKIRRLYRQLKNTNNSIRGDKKIAAKLWKLSADYGIQCKEGTYIDMDLSITYLADIMGSKRETVSRQLKILSEQGLVIIKKHRFIIPNRDELNNYFKKP